MGNKITLLEAATFLGVSKQTLRNWEKAGKIQCIRNPMNHYREYDMEQLMELKSTIDGETPIAPVEELRLQDGSNKTKRIVSKVHNLIRDADMSSSLLDRFDEISKLMLVLGFHEEESYDPFLPKPEEDMHDYCSRVRQEYQDAVRQMNYNAPPKYQTIELNDQALYKACMEIGRLSSSELGPDVRGLAYEDIVSGTFDKNDNQQFFTPFQITEFMAALLSFFRPNTICDPACGTGGFLTKSASMMPSAQLIGLEVDERLAWIANVNLFLHGASNYYVKPLDANCGGSLGPAADYLNSSIDAIITNPPFGSEYSERAILDRFVLGKEKTSRRRGILFLEESYNLLRDGGVVAIVIDQGVLNSKTTTDVRDFIFKHFAILGIIDLPDNAFLPYASVSTSICILRKMATPLINKAETFFAKAEKIGRKANGDEDWVYLEDGSKRLDSDLPSILEKWAFWVAGRQLVGIQDNCYVGSISSTFVEDRTMRMDYAFHHPYRFESKKVLEQSKYPLKMLSELCDERRESYVPSSDPEATTIRFTGLANIESYTGKAVQTVVPAVSIKSAVKHYLPGDIVIAKMRPSLRKIAVMDFESDGYVSSECSVFTVKKDASGQPLMDPLLLSSILRSDFGYGQIMPFVTGIGRPRVSDSDLRSIRIPFPPKEIQEKAVQTQKETLAVALRMRQNAADIIRQAEEMESDGLNQLAVIMGGRKI